MQIQIKRFSEKHGFSQLPQFLFDQLPCKNVVDESEEFSRKACNNRIKHSMTIHIDYLDFQLLTPQQIYTSGC